MAVAHFHFQLFRLHSRAVLQLPLRSDWPVIDTARRKFRWPVIKTRLGVKISAGHLWTRLGCNSSYRIGSSCPEHRYLGMAVLRPSGMVWQCFVIQVASGGSFWPIRLERDAQTSGPTARLVGIVS